MQIVTGTGPLFPDTLVLGDCLEVMKRIPDASVDMILTDLPYGTTSCHWDSVIPLNEMWSEFTRVINPNCIIALTASQPFTSALLMSNPRLYRYCWYWIKNTPTGFLNAKRQPLRQVEEVLIFGGSRYSPQGLTPYNKTCYNSKSTGGASVRTVNKYAGGGSMRTQGRGYFQEWENYPSNPLLFPSDTTKLHPTQKPVALFEYLIRTYTNAGELVLDITAGSMTTAAAATRCGRRYICIEKDITYFMKGADRIRAIERERQVSGGAV